jgi:hypothetical protein
MANKLGAAFLRCSLGPLNYAGGCILSSKFVEGLNELSSDNLYGGFSRGIEETARHAGVGVTDVERLLPMSDVRAAAARLDAAQKGAVAAWQMYAGHLGGLMKGVADLTVDGRAPDVSQFLARLAKKVVRDKPLSEPLQALADAVAHWLDLVEACSDRIGDGGELAAAYRARRLRRVGAIGAGVVALAAIGGLALWIGAVRSRVDAALSQQDPCAATAIDPSDLSRASGAQQKRAAELSASCEERKKKEAEERAAVEKREADARAAAEKKKAREAACDALAKDLAAGKLTAEDEALAGPKAALLARVAKGAVDKGDLVEGALPCADAPAGKPIAEAFAAAVAATPSAWARADDVSDQVYAALVDKRDALPGSPKQALAAHADKVAMKAIVSRDEAFKARATRLCNLKKELGIPGGKYCATLFVLAKK